MKINALVVSLVVALPLFASARPDDPVKPSPPATGNERSGSLSPEEVKIVAHVHHANQVTIDLGKTAKQRGTAAVKRYGETVARDHATSNKELVALAKKKGLAKIPAETPETEAERSEMKRVKDATAKLGKLRGADFDRAYLRMMVDDHEKELARSDVLIVTVTDPDLKSMLAARKVTLQRHADAARELQQGAAQASVTPKRPERVSPR